MAKVLVVMAPRPVCSSVNVSEPNQQKLRHVVVSDVDAEALLVAVDRVPTTAKLLICLDHFPRDTWGCTPS